ncbi:integral membrane protein [Lasiosphaeria ovina]|uniref:Integral membrane protein n=1 Tax=Lasiosphaeria ovina TaxID=92902 RepID=A0AAE0NNJ6_9PEZI|nr:integral membrane protein [Lasiosphaeria ovina]
MTDAAPGQQSGSSDAAISGVLFGILVPHVVCTVFILARTWSRLFLLRKWFLDDSLIVLAWAFSTAVCVVYSIAAESPRLRTAVSLSSADYYDGTAGTTDQEDTLRPYLLRTYLGLVLYQLCLCFTKLSVLTFYLRIFSSRPVEKRLAWATTVVVLLYCAPLLFMSIFQCHPAAGYFFGAPVAKCFSFVPLLIASASLHTATDAWLIVLIIPCIVRLADLPRRQKAALALVLSLSIFVIAASLTRLQLSLRANYRPDVDDDSGEQQLIDADDQVANTLAFFVMTVLELDLALICASAPTLRPLLARFWPRLLTGLGGMEPLAGGGGGPHRFAGDSASVDLTSVYNHGYPTAPAPTATRSANPSMASLPHNPYPPPPLPPSAALLSSAHRTPTTLSLRSFISNMAAPRSRGQTLDDDRAGLPLLDPAAEGQGQGRRSSVGFEGYYNQYLPGNGERDGEEDGSKKRWSRRSRVTVVSGRWGDSQESFVLGVNDPNSPTRLSPVLSTAGSGVHAGGVGKGGGDGDGDGDGEIQARR